MVCEIELLISIASFFWLIFEIMFRAARDFFFGQLQKNGSAHTIFINNYKLRELVITENSSLFYLHSINFNKNKKEFLL